MTKKKKPPRSKRKPADLRFKIRCCFIQGARMVSKKKERGGKKGEWKEVWKKESVPSCEILEEGIFFIENNGFRYIARSKKNEYRGRGSLG